jgi:hypothetical protein
MSQARARNGMCSWGGEEGLHATASSPRLPLASLRASSSMMRLALSRVFARHGTKARRAGSNGYGVDGVTPAAYTLNATYEGSGDAHDAATAGPAKSDSDGTSLPRSTPLDPLRSIQAAQCAAEEGAAPSLGRCRVGTIGRFGATGKVLLGDDQQQGDHDYEEVEGGVRASEAGELRRCGTSGTDLGPPAAPAEGDQDIATAAENGAAAADPPHASAHANGGLAHKTGEPALLGQQHLGQGMFQRSPAGKRQRRKKKADEGAGLSFWSYLACSLTLHVVQQVSVTVLCCDGCWHVNIADVPGSPCFCPFFQ